MSDEERRSWQQQRAEQEASQRQSDFMARLKAALKPANDQEWQVLEMQIKPIYELRRGRSGRDRGRRSSDSSSPTQQLREQSRAVREEIEELIKLDNPTPDALKAKLDRYRSMRAQRQAYEEQQRQQTEQRLKQAREQLRSIVTVRQEAVLFVYGILD